MPLHRLSRRSTRLLLGTATAAAAVITVLPALPAAAAADTASTGQHAGRPSGPTTRGLYGAQDPTYDGVYRQGLSIIALASAGSRPQRDAVQWLLRQQCRDGRWTSYRPTLRARCTAGDTNATAMAVMALATLDRTRPARQGMTWLRSVQQRDGGWYFSSAYGTTSDVNSTTLVLQAASSLGIRPGRVTRAGASGFDYLESMQLRCTEPTATRGALGFSTDLPAANDFATAPALQALSRSALPVAPARSWAPPASRSCATGWALSTQAGAASYLAAALRAHPDGLPYAAGGIDVGSTANAVLGLVAARTARPQVRTGMAALHAKGHRFVVAEHRTVPGSAALLTLASLATEEDPRAFATSSGDLDLVRRIRGSIRP